MGGHVAAIYGTRYDRVSGGGEFSEVRNFAHFHAMPDTLRLFSEAKMFGPCLPLVRLPNCP
jgi:hypothetical protein